MALTRFILFFILVCCGVWYMGNNALKIKVAIGEQWAIKHDASKVAMVTEIVPVTRHFGGAMYKKTMGYRIRYHYEDGKLLEDSQSAFLVRHRRVEG